jgi:invasion protein IalB
VTAVIRVPLGTALPPGLRVELGEGRHADGAFQVCEADGCTAVLPLDAAARAALAGLSTTRVLFVPYGSGAPVAFEVPVAGFAQAVEAL